MEESKSKGKAILVIGGLMIFSATLGATSVLIAWNGKCASIDKASRGPVYEIPLGGSTAQLLTVYRNRAYTMKEAVAK